jgi:16S rRNA pseudouridine516 synthase
VKSQRTRLDRFLSEREQLSRRTVRLLLAQGRIRLDGEMAGSISQVVDKFTLVTLDERVLQSNQARYLMLNKPPGVVSATRDLQHRTAVDLLSVPYANALHIVGRLDINSTGLLLLTNDGRWSRALSSPAECIAKTYRVRLERPICADCVTAFAEGMYFAFEGITTRPASLRVISEFEAEVGLVEGRYHQIKRMFGRFDNRVLALHRTAVGNLALDRDLEPGASRGLTRGELDALGVKHCLGDEASHGRQVSAGSWASVVIPPA